MTSIRQSILLDLVDRIGALPGFECTLRGYSNRSTSSELVTAVVAFVSESKQIETSEHYNATMQVGVVLQVNVEDADATEDESNPFRYLDRMVVEVEKLMHSPDQWGPSPSFSFVEINGHEVSDPDEDSTLAAMLRLTFQYRHRFDDPEQ